MNASGLARMRAQPSGNACVRKREQHCVPLPKSIVRNGRRAPRTDGRGKRAARARDVKHTGTVGKVLAGMEPKQHNALVATLSKRAAPYERWGPNLSPRAPASVV